MRTEGGTYSFVACLSRMTIDHASLARQVLNLHGLIRFYRVTGGQAIVGARSMSHTLVIYEKYYIP